MRSEVDVLGSIIRPAYNSGVKMCGKQALCVISCNRVDAGIIALRGTRLNQREYGCVIQENIL